MNKEQKSHRRYQEPLAIEKAAGEVMESVGKIKPWSRAMTIQESEWIGKEGQRLQRVWSEWRHQRLSESEVMEEYQKIETGWEAWAKWHFLDIWRQEQAKKNKELVGENGKKREATRWRDLLKGLGVLSVEGPENRVRKEREFAKGGEVANFQEERLALESQERDQEGVDRATTKGSMARNAMGKGGNEKDTAERGQGILAQWMEWVEEQTQKGLLTMSGREKEQWMKAREKKVEEWKKKYKREWRHQGWSQGFEEETWHWLTWVKGRQGWDGIGEVCVLSTDVSGMEIGPWATGPEVIKGWLLKERFDRLDDIKRLDQEFKEFDRERQAGGGSGLKHRTGSESVFGWVSESMKAVKKRWKGEDSEQPEGIYLEGVLSPWGHWRGGVYDKTRGIVGVGIPGLGDRVKRQSVRWGAVSQWLHEYWGEAPVMPGSGSSSSTTTAEERQHDERLVMKTIEWMKTWDEEDWNGLGLLWYWMGTGPWGVDRRQSTGLKEILEWENMFTHKERKKNAQKGWGAEIQSKESGAHDSDSDTTKKDKTAEPMKSKAEGVKGKASWKERLKTWSDQWGRLTIWGGMESAYDTEKAFPYINSGYQKTLGGYLSPRKTSKPAWGSWRDGMASLQYCLKKINQTQESAQQEDREMQEDAGRGKVSLQWIEARLRLDAVERWIQKGRGPVKDWDKGDKWEEGENKGSGQEGQGGLLKRGVEPSNPGGESLKGEGGLIENNPKKGEWNFPDKERKGDSEAASWEKIGHRIDQEIRDRIQCVQTIQKGLLSLPKEEVEKDKKNSSQEGCDKEGRDAKWDTDTIRARWWWKNTMARYLRQGMGGAWSEDRDKPDWIGAEVVIHQSHSKEDEDHEGGVECETPQEKDQWRRQWAGWLAQYGTGGAKEIDEPRDHKKGVLNRNSKPIFNVGRLWDKEESEYGTMIVWWLTEGLHPEWEKQWDRQHGQGAYEQQWKAVVQDALERRVVSLQESEEYIVMHMEKGGSLEETWKGWTRWRGLSEVERAVQEGRYKPGMRRVMGWNPQWDSIEQQWKEGQGMEELWVKRDIEGDGLKGEAMQKAGKENEIKDPFREEKERLISRFRACEKEEDVTVQEGLQKEIEKARVWREKKNKNKNDNKNKSHDEGQWKGYQWEWERIVKCWLKNNPGWKKEIEGWIEDVHLKGYIGFGLRIQEGDGGWSDWGDHLGLHDGVEGCWKGWRMGWKEMEKDWDELGIGVSDPEVREGLRQVKKWMHQQWNRAGVNVWSELLRQWVQDGAASEDLFREDGGWIREALLHHWEGLSGQESEAWLKNGYVAGLGFTARGWQMQEGWGWRHEPWGKWTLWRDRIDSADNEEEWEETLTDRQAWAVCVQKWREDPQWKAWLEQDGLKTMWRNEDLDKGESKNAVKEKERGTVKKEKIELEGSEGSNHDNQENRSEERRESEPVKKTIASVITGWRIMRGEKRVREWACGRPG